MLPLHSLLLCVLCEFPATSALATLATPSVGESSSDILKTCSVNNFTQVQHVAVVDAGSTGSRIHVYEFERNSDGSLTFQHETYYYVSPGLSSYAFTPGKGANSIRSLIKIARYVVPPELQKQTPLIVKATAGLRLLKPQDAHNLLKEVFKMLTLTEFLLPPNAVELIDGISEGFFGWVTVNYLIGAFNNRERLAVSMDLGGGSTQLSLVPVYNKTISSLPKEDLKNIYLFNSYYKVYTRSYLGLGLMSARFQMMGGTENTKDGPLVIDDSLKSSCLPSLYQGSWKHGPNTYTVQGMEQEEAGFDLCYISALQVLREANVQEIPEMRQMTIYAFSYYFDVAVDAKLIDKRGGILKVLDYKNAALKECSNHGRHIYLCMDLTYIYTLLRVGFQLDDVTAIHVKHIENGAELSWSLGMAYHILSSLTDT